MEELKVILEFAKIKATQGYMKPCLKIKHNCSKCVQFAILSLPSWLLETRSLLTATLPSQQASRIALSFVSSAPGLLHLTYLWTLGT